MIELVLRVPEAAAEALSDALVDEHEALAVSVEDAQAGSPGEVALFGEPGLPGARAAWPDSRLSALFDALPRAEAAAAALLAAHPVLRIEALRAVEDRDWVRATQAQFPPTEIAPGYWVVPSWHVPPAAAARVIRLDPGMAFGTGTHPTTRMCLRWLARQVVTGMRVLDYGCGSGILAIAAAQGRARAVDAVDLDPQALQATRANATANQVELAGIGGPGAAQGRYDVVVANILAAPLKVLAPLLSGHVAPGGRLALAGLLERQMPELQAAYAPWIELQLDTLDDGWALLAGRRREDRVA
jgi:ribosomal protein L11 methyltransferase